MNKKSKKRKKKGKNKIFLIFIFQDFQVFSSNLFSVVQPILQTFLAFKLIQIKIYQKANNMTKIDSSQRINRVKLKK